MASMNTRLNIEKLDGNIVQNYVGSKQVGFKQLGPGVETGVHEVHDEKRVWFEVELQRAQGDREAKSGVAKQLGVAGIQQQNELVDETNVTLFAKVRCFLIQSGTGSMQVLNGFEFEVEPLRDHTFKLAHDKEQHLACELFGYREDSNGAAFAVAAVEKIYAHESLTFNNTVACEVISKWKARLKDDMDALSDVYVLSDGYRKCSDDSYGYYWEYAQAEIWATKGLLDKAKGNVLGMKIIRDQSGNTLRVSKSRFYKGKLVQTLLEGHTILSLEGSLFGDCDVEKNGKWSCIYAVGS
ncbi:hypothetical protein Tco_0415719 [Tanacetum coccineum]